MWLETGGSPEAISWLEASTASDRCDVPVCVGSGLAHPCSAAFEWLGKMTRRNVMLCFRVCIRACILPALLVANRASAEEPAHAVPPAQGAPVAVEGGAAPFPDPAKPEEKKEDKKEDRRPGWDLDAELLGLRGSSLTVGGGDRHASTLGLSAASMGISNYAGSIFTYRAAGRSLLGGGGGGLEGELGGSIAVGAGILVDDGHQGPFVRVGFNGYLLANDSFFHSNLQFPQGQVGWHLGSREGFLLEAALTGGPMLDGRFNVGDEARRKLGGSPSYGAYADLFVGPLTGTLSWIRTEARSDPGTAVDGLEGQICLSTGRAQKETGLGLCFDGRYTRGDVQFGMPIQTNAASTTYLGLTLGFGFTQSKKEK